MFGTRTDPTDAGDRGPLSLTKRLLPAATHAPLGYARRYVLANSAQRRDLHRRLRRHVFFRVAKRYTPAMVAQWPDGRFIVNTWDDEVGLKTFRDGPYDGEMLDMVMQRLRHLVPGFGVAGRTVLEIGANVGTTTIPLVRRYGAAHVVAFEPAPENCRLFAANIAANGLEGRVTLHPLALSDHAAAQRLTMNPGNSGDYRLVVEEDGRPPAAFGTGGEDRWQTIEVRTTTLDRMVFEGAVDLTDVGLAWIDVQGHEPYLLSGAEQLTQRDIPIVMEYWPYGLDQAGGLERLEAILAAHYDFFCEPDRPQLRSIRDLAAFAKHKGDFRWWTNLILLRGAWLAAP